jgi:hypothetical protein
MDDDKLIDATDAAEPPDTPDELPPEPPPKTRSVLMDILDRAKSDTEAETGRLMEGLKAREEAERLAREDEERKRAEEARKRVEEERRKREDALKEYEARKQREAEEKARAAMPPPPVAATVEQPKPKPKSKAPLFVALGVAVAAGGFAAWWFSVPHGEPVAFALERAPDTARPGAFQTEPVPYGAKTVGADAAPMAPERVVAIHAPEKYQAAPPVAANGEPKRGGGKKRGGAAKTESEGLGIKIQTGILGGGKGKIIR